jgi:hypothetical protein
VREGGLAYARNVLNQQVSACEQARQSKPDLRLFAEYDATYLFYDPVYAFGHDAELSHTGLKRDIDTLEDYRRAE